jgi:hypothetical protein
VRIADGYLEPPVTRPEIKGMYSRRDGEDAEKILGKLSLRFLSREFQISLAGIKSKIKRRLLPATSVVAGISLAISASAGPLATTPSPPEDDAAGQTLADRLRSAEPDENSEVHGTLIIHEGKVVTQVPVICRVVLKGASWETVYETSATTNIGAEKLVVIHSTNGPNQYLFAQAAQPGTALPKLEPVAPADADIPLADSDFSLADLGLEFLHWPQQARLPDETKLGQACNVLESRNPAAREIVRIRSDIDQETGGLLIATGYDAGGHVIKEFSLSGSSFKKVNGHWRLEKMEIRNHKKRSRTELKFDINE